MLALYVDIFGIKYYYTNNSQHLLSTFKEHCTILINEDGTNHWELTFESNSERENIDVSTPSYVA